MKSSLLTSIQQDWLHHINKATTLNMSMVAYAKQNNLALPAFYHARSMLIKKGVLHKSTHPSIMSVATTLSHTVITTSCRITLCNGVAIELADVDLTALLTSANCL
tara:strand:+ start:80 stop:397 length:318 start_codon:yes stop_codon:yes gene_type:complete